MSTTIDSYTSLTSAVYLDNSLPCGGQVFTGTHCTLTSAALYLSRNSVPDGTLYMSIYNITGTFGTNAIPTGSALATSDTISPSSLSPSYLGLAWTAFNFSGSNQITLFSSTYYAFILRYTGTSLLPTAWVNFGYGTSPIYGNSIPPGSCSSWTPSTLRSQNFYIYGNLIVSTINKISTVSQSSILKVNSITKTTMNKINGVSN